jgi:hypothetical protein
MPVYHLGTIIHLCRTTSESEQHILPRTNAPKIALFKLKKDADPAKVKQWQNLAEGMVGNVSGKP